jgi:serine protease Do
MNMACSLVIVATCLAASPPADHLLEAQKRVVKLYGTGGVGRIEGYGSGILVSGDGLILTVDSPLLSTDSVRVLFADGTRRTARVVGVDRAFQLAALQLDGDRPTEPFPYFDLQEPAPPAREGDPVWALSNLFGIATGNEAVSVQKGIISAFTTLATRRGIEDFPLPGKLYLLDMVTNNPGAAGGGLVDSNGHLVGLLAKEWRNKATRTWMSVALPAEQIRSFIDQVKAGKAEKNRPRITEPDIDRRALARVDLRGIRLLPEVLDRTPPFVDGVDPQSPAQQAGILPDDLIIYVGDVIIPSTTELRRAILDFANDQPINLMILRNNELLPILLAPSGSSIQEPDQEHSTP